MNAQMKRISDCAEILPGYALKARAEHEREGSFQVVMAKHVPDVTPYRYIEAHKLRMTLTGSPQKYQVRTGDVLFLSRGIRNSAAAVEYVPEPTVASSTFYILRVQPGIYPAYLAWCLNQLPIQARIGQIRTGAGTPIVPRNLLGAIEIPVPPLEDQQRLAELGALMIRELEICTRLIRTTELHHRLLGQRLIAELSEH
jgi:restriction endonuclease S subunit